LIAILLSCKETVAQPWMEMPWQIIENDTELGLLFPSGSHITQFSFEQISL
jgi:hypothetical protein